VDTATYGLKSGSPLPQLTSDRPGAGDKFATGSGVIRPVRAGTSTPRQARLAGLALAVVVGLLLAATACGGSSSPDVAQISSTTTASTSAGGPEAGPAAYSSCMRAHAVPNFPDPDKQGFVRVTPSSGINPKSPTFVAALQACQKLFPNPAPPSPQEQQTQLHGKLNFSKCIRNHGVADFPDPNPQGELTTEMLTAAGIDVHAPAVQAAARTCLPAADGAITAAQIERAESAAAR
jgi:hypothetical protein